MRTRLVQCLELEKFQYFLLWYKIPSASTLGGAMVCDVSFPELFLLLLLQQDLHKELKIKIKKMHTTVAS